MKKALLISAISCSVAFSLHAKEMPKAESASVNAQGSLLATAAFKQPNRIYIEGSKIERAVYDTTVVKAERDPSTGSLYVIPLTREKTGIFVVSESGQTHSVTISPMDKITPQTIRLKESASFNGRSSKLSSEHAALAYEERVSKLLKMIPTLSQSDAEGLSGAVTDGYIVANPLGSWNLLGLSLERYRMHNPTKEKLTVNEPGFWRRGVAAVATEAAELAPGAGADLWIVREVVR